MTSGQPVDRELIIGVTPGARPDGRLVVGLARAGALGVLDLGADRARAEGELALVVDRWSGTFGVRVAAPGAGGWAPADLPGAVDTVVVGEPALVAAFAGRGRRVLAEVTSLAEARGAVAAGADGLVAQGSEAGGRVGDETAFVLLQRLAGAVDRPVWLKGGIGLHTAAAALAGGAVGVVVDTQLALARESTLPPAVRAAIGAMDGSETVVAAGTGSTPGPICPPSTRTPRRSRSRPAWAPTTCGPSSCLWARTARSPARWPPATRPPAGSWRRCGPRSTTSSPRPASCGRWPPVRAPQRPGERPTRSPRAR